MKKFFKLYACLLVLGIFIACDPEPEPLDCAEYPIVYP